MIKQEYVKSEPSAVLKALDEFRSGAVGLNECCQYRVLKETESLLEKKHTGIPSLNDEMVEDIRRAFVQCSKNKSLFNAVISDDRGGHCFHPPLLIQRRGNLSIRTSISMLA
ncbi:hypothetical protein ANN_15640 [Periplaneta americana]|uniref:Uncharacterized protein n=1 Tax=Periplaneta americana TaxID=6978 RepID=A0ABQ8SHS9_PERAM|nr:hypothetical protein ANN_15640 [Periplaneta americana]